MSNKACIRERCTDPCPGSCGINARCNVINHTPICTCLEGYIGDPFQSCHPQPPPRKSSVWINFRNFPNTDLIVLEQDPVFEDPCNPSPCGPNAQCSNGDCSCLSEYHGDPYTSCRPECVLNSDCPRDKACLRNKCIDPCPGTCSQNAICEVLNHIPMCSCPGGHEGNAFVQCRPIKSMLHLLLVPTNLLLNCKIL